RRTAVAPRPLCGSGAFAPQPRLPPTLDHLDGYRTLLTVSDRQSPPGARIERLAPRRHRLPGWLWTTTTALIRGWQRVEGTHRGGAGHAQHIAHATRRASPDIAPGAFGNAPRVGRGRPGAVAHRVPTPAGGTTGSRARHAPHQQRSP